MRHIRVAGFAGLFPNVLRGINWSARRTLRRRFFGGSCRGLCAERGRGGQTNQGKSRPHENAEVSRSQLLHRVPGQTDAPLPDAGLAGTAYAISVTRIITVGLFLKSEPASRASAFLGTRTLFELQNGKPGTPRIRKV